MVPAFCILVPCFCLSGGILASQIVSSRERTEEESPSSCKMDVETTNHAGGRGEDKDPGSGEGRWMRPGELRAAATSLVPLLYGFLLSTSMSQMSPYRASAFPEKVPFKVDDSPLVQRELQDTRPMPLRMLGTRNAMAA